MYASPPARFTIARKELRTDSSFGNTHEEWNEHTVVISQKKYIQRMLFESTRPNMADMKMKQTRKIPAAVRHVRVLFPDRSSCIPWRRRRCILR